MTDETPDLDGDDQHTAQAVHAAARQLNVSRIAWALAALCIGMAVVITASVVLGLLHELHDARDDIERNRVENTCRAEVAARLDVIDSEISYNGWVGLAAYVAGDFEEARRRGQLIRQLGNERSIAVAERRNLVELCDDD